MFHECEVTMLGGDRTWARSGFEHEAVDHRSRPEARMPAPLLTDPLRTKRAPTPPVSPRRETAGRASSGPPW